jgi:maltose alpha-D-glucosyltransferase/alpha-amylase
MAREHPCTIIAKIKNGRHSGILFDAVYTESFRLHLWETIRRKKSHRGAQGSVVGSLSRLKPFERNAPPPARSEMLKAEQSNTSFVFGNESILKLYRKVEEGVNPDLELGRFLSEKRRFSHVPKYQGWIQYHKKGQSPLTLGILQELVPNQGDAWSFMQDAVGRYFENVQSRRNHGSFPAFPASLLDPVPKGPAPFYQEAVGPVILEMIALLGRRTAELHRSLSSEHQDPAFSPESFSLLYQRSLFQSLQSHSKRVFQVFRKQFHKLPAPLQETARPLLNSEKAVIRKFRRILRRKIATQKMRIHGDYHLGQVLFTGNDFWIIDFEGEPLKPLSERKLKRSPMRDVAGMIRSFHYAAYTTLLQHPLYHEHRELEEWAERWYQVTGRMFLHSYLSSLENAPILPNSREDLSLLLDAFLIDKAVYELHYELNNRPDWTLIPVKGILLLLKNA